MKSDKRTVENLGRAKKMRDDGMTHREIGVVFGIGESTVRQWLYPEKYKRHKERAVAWTRAWVAANPEKVREYYEHRRQGLTREQRDEQNARQRVRYASDPKFRAALRRLRNKYQGTAQGRIAHKMRLAVLGFSGRFPSVFRGLMESINGMSQVAFTQMFRGDGVFDHVVPICAFDLTNPGHVVRCNYWKNLRLVERRENELKGSKHDPVDIMSLPWIGTQDALIQAQTFISRQLKRLKREPEVRCSECAVV